jgi:hypothetical protein
MLSTGGPRTAIGPQIVIGINIASDGKVTDLQLATFFFFSF